MTDDARSQPDFVGVRRVHLAVIEPGLVRAMLEGRKRIESRFSRTRRAPFGQIDVGDRVYFLARRAGLIVTGRVERVESFEGLDEQGVRGLRDRYGPCIAAAEAYWYQKNDARFATLMWFDRFEKAAFAPDDVHGRERSYRSAWIVRPGEQCVYPTCCQREAQRCTRTAPSLFEPSCAGT